MEEYIIIGLLILLLILVIVLLIRQSRVLSDVESDEEEEQEELRRFDHLGKMIENGQTSLKNDVLNEVRASRQETNQNVTRSMETMGNSIREEQKNASQALSDRMTDRLNAMTNTVEQKLDTTNKLFTAFTDQSKEAQERTDKAVNDRLKEMQTSNEKQLESMRNVVEQKLENTLNERISKSFEVVSNRLEEVYKGLGEMKSLAGDVGDLKKVLSGVKTRGILGEVQLGAIIKEILAPGQYDENVPTKKNSRDVVEYAIRLPGGDDEECCYLPIDAKFPADTYQHLLDAYETADKEQVAEAQKALEIRIKNEARDIRDKYIDPPHTTKFGVLFLPFEGLYAEVVQMGLNETLQQQYNVSIAGPTTLAALLNSLQMGFHTLAIQKRSGEIEKVLGAVKTEFGKFEGALGEVQKKMQTTSDDLERLVGVRTRQINRKLKSVTELPENEAEIYLPEAEKADDGEED